MGLFSEGARSCDGRALARGSIPLYCNPYNKMKKPAFAKAMAGAVVRRGIEPLLQG